MSSESCVTCMHLAFVETSSTVAWQFSNRWSTLLWIPRDSSFRAPSHPNYHVAVTDTCRWGAQSAYADIAGLAPYCEAHLARLLHLRILGYVVLQPRIKLHGWIGIAAWVSDVRKTACCFCSSRNRSHRSNSSSITRVGLLSNDLRLTRW